MTFQFDANAATDRGLNPDRPVNEDSCYSAYQAQVPAQLIAQKGALFIAADGVGGHQGGEHASQTAVNTISQAYYSGATSGNLLADLVAAVEEANRVIYHSQISDPNLYGMSTTVTAAVIYQDALLIAHVGDSRAYLLRPGEAFRLLTVDHTWVNEARLKGLLSDEDAANHPQRNVITRSLGAKLQVEVDAIPDTFQPGDSLLLCSDGLSGLVGDEELHDLLANGHSAAATTHQMIELAKAHGGHDNITAVVVRGHQGTAPVLAAARRLSRTPSLAMLGAYFLVGVVVMAILVGMLWAFSGQPGVAPPPASAPLPKAPTATRWPADQSATLAPAVGGWQAVNPPDGAQYDAPDQAPLTFTWAGPELREGDRYQVWLDDRALDAVDHTSSLVPSHSYGEHRWQVRVVDRGGNEQPGRIGPEWRFVILDPTSTPLPPTPKPTDVPVPAVVLVAPIGGEHPSPITFQWKGTLEPGQAYQVTLRHEESREVISSEFLATLSWSKEMPADKFGAWVWTVQLMRDGQVVGRSSEQLFYFNPVSSGPEPTAKPR